MYGILSTDRKRITRTVNKREVTFEPGEFGYDALELGSVSQLHLRSAIGRANIGVVTIKEASWDKQRTVKTGTGYETDADGNLKIVDGVVQQTIEVSPRPFKNPQMQLRNRVDAKRDQVQAAGIVVTIGDSDYIVATDEKSRNLLDGSILLANEGGWTEGTDFWTVKSVNIVADVEYVGATVDLPMSIAELKEVGKAVGKHVKLAHGASRVHKAAVDALDSLDAVLAYDLELGWPPVAPTVSYVAPE